MKRSNRLVLLIGVFLAIVAFVGIALILGGGGGGGTAQATPASVVKTVVASRDIPLGVVVTGDMLAVQDLKVSERKTKAFENPGLVIGQTARRAIAKGSQLEENDFSGDGGAITNLQVPAGLRAIAVQVDQVSGVGTVIKSGDYVDMVIGLTGDKFPVVQVQPGNAGISVVAGLNSTSVKLLIDGMQVIGTLLPSPTTPAQGQQPAASGQPQTTLSNNAEIVVLAVSAQQAEVIKYAQLEGSISLVLRSPKDFVDASGNPVVSVPVGTTGVILKTLVDGGYGVLRPQLVEAILPK